jgi:hypothetical protein
MGPRIRNTQTHFFMQNLILQISKFLNLPIYK